MVQIGLKAFVIGLVIGLAAVGAPAYLIYSQNLNLIVIIRSNQGSINSLESQISDLQSEVDSLHSRVLTLEATKSDLESKVTYLDDRVNSDAATISSLNSQIETLNFQITLQQSQIGSLNSRVFGLRNQLARLESIIDLQLSDTLISQTVGIPAGRNVSWSFSTFDYAGYIMINYNATSEVHIEVETTSGRFITNNQSFASSIVVPVIPGESYNVMIWNDDELSSVSVTINMTYVYQSAPLLSRMEIRDWQFLVQDHQDAKMRVALGRTSRTTNVASANPPKTTKGASNPKSEDR